jgi:glutamine amidotransferase-like uncharacterized protein
VLLLLGLSLTLNFGFVSAADSPNSTTQNLTSSKSTSTTAKLSTTVTVKNTLNSAASTGVSANSTKNIRVLIYSGTGSASDCVNGIKTALTSANNNNLVPGYRFTYATSGTITTSLLSNYDLLAMPGGDSGLKYIQSISGSVIRNFVSTGHGYLGICAGAYAGSQYVDGLYPGWGVAPDVRCKAVSYEGTLPVTYTSSGSQLLGSSGTITLHHYNGAAMYGNGITYFACYADSSTGYKGYGAIVGDTYGSGRSVLSGPHPELTPQNPFLLAKLIIWAVNVKAAPISNTATLSQINSAAKNVKAYMDVNHKLPSSVTVAGKLVTPSQFLYLLTSDLIKTNSGSTSSVTIKSVASPSTAVDNVKTGNILKTEYLAIANRINSYINTYSKAPSYTASSLGNIQFTSLVYMYSKIMDFYSTNNRLPGYVSIAHWTFG